MLTMKAVKMSNNFEILLLITFMGKLLGTNIYTENLSKVTLNCTYTSGQRSLQWIRHVNGSKQLQLSKHEIISPFLPEELYQRLEVYVDDSRRVYNLTIHKVTQTDEGEYLCSHIDERDNDVIYTLYVIQPVENLVLLNKTTDNTLNGVEGQDFHIQCEAQGGQPPSFLTIKIQNREVAQGNQSIVHTIKNMTRDFDNATVECVANNSALDIPQSTVAYIYLYLKPLAPIFDRDTVVLKENEPLEMSCTSTGSRPVALFDWFMEDKEKTSYSTQNFAYDATTDTWAITSVLTHTVARQNDGQLITCRASNEADPIGISASQPIQVQFAPKIDVNNMTFNQLENLRVISCIATGNPSNYTYYQWKHTSSNGKLIREIGGNKNGELVLPVSHTDESYQDNGIYVCKAGNGIKDKDGMIEQTGYGFVTIIAQPVFMPNIKGVNKSTVHGEVGRAVEITVKVYSIPKYESVTWYRGINKDLKTIPSPKYSLSETYAIVKGFFYNTEVDLDGFILTLKINNLTTDDFTTYTIQLENNVGSPAEYVVTLELSENKVSDQDDISISVVVGSCIGGVASVILGTVIVIASRKTGCKLGKIPDSQAKSENDIHFYQNEEFAARENREPKYEDLRSDCQGNQDLHTTYDSLNCDQSAVVSNDIATKMGGGESKLRINESHNEYANLGGDYSDVL